MDRSIVRSVVERTDLQALVSKHVVLRRAGAAFKGRCPFHEEKTPSFVVTPARGFYYCFGCGESGDAIDFLRKLRGLDFKAAVLELADAAGIYVEEGAFSAPARIRVVGLRRVAEVALAWFRSQLTPSGAGRYLEGRGYDAARIQAWELGGAPDGWDGLVRHLRQQQADPDDAVDLGVLVRHPETGRVYDRFRGRAVFPLRDESGRLVGFAGRKMEGGAPGPKYVNTPESPVYRKGAILYGAHRALPAISRSRSVVLVEGYTDVHAFHAAGVKNAVALAGTALTEELALRLRRLVRTVYLAGDPDAPGQAAMLEHMRALAGGLDVRHVELPDDPQGTLEAHGPQALRDAVERASCALAWTARQVSAAHDFTPAGRSKVAAELVPVLRRYRGVEREQSVRLAAELAGVSPRSLAALVGREGASLPADPDAIQVAVLDPVLREVVWCLLHHPELGARFRAADPDWFPVELRSTLALLAVGRQQDALAALPREWVPAVAALACEESRHGLGQVEGVLDESLRRIELAYVQAAVGAQTNGHRLQLQRRRLELRASLKERA
jgi:DNA primase